METPPHPSSSYVSRLFFFSFSPRLRAEFRISISLRQNPGARLRDILKVYLASQVITFFFFFWFGDNESLTRKAQWDSSRDFEEGVDMNMQIR